MTTEELRLNVEKALDEIRPFLQSDGGDIELISIDNDTLVKEVRFSHKSSHVHIALISHHWRITVVLLVHPLL